MIGAILVTVGFVGTVLLELIYLMVARRARWLAHPNARSSHQVPTPTAGGVAMVLPVLAYLSAVSWQLYPAALGVFMGAALLSLVGLWDDLQPLGRRVRLGAQLMSVAAVLWGLQMQAAPEAADFAAVWAAAWPIWGLAAALFAFAWHVNLYNFMDGIDGIAAAQCLLLCLGLQLLTGGVSGWNGELVWVTTGTVLGFLVFNWPPARIFMGDVGSGLLGLVTGSMVLNVWLADGVPLITSLILLAGFWFDASYTLYVRMTSGQAFTEAHRSHLYQKLAVRKGHLWTTGLFLLFGCCYLLPLAWLSLRFPGASIVFLLAAVAPLAYGARRFNAGHADPPPGAATPGTTSSDTESPDTESSDTESPDKSQE